VGQPDRAGASPLDTDRFFVVCQQHPGRLSGTTGPSSPDPSTGQAYGLDFPLLDMADFVTVHRALLAHLGIEPHLLGGPRVARSAACRCCSGR
jgi:homoserine O-acetyltransferase